MTRFVVGVDAYIDPAGCTAFTEIYGKFVTARRADVGIGPYNQTDKCMRIRREFPILQCILPGGA